MRDARCAQRGGKHPRRAHGRTACGAAVFHDRHGRADERAGAHERGLAPGSAQRAQSAVGDQPGWAGWPAREGGRVSLYCVLAVHGRGLRAGWAEERSGQPRRVQRARRGLGGQGSVRLTLKVLLSEFDTSPEPRREIIEQRIATYPPGALEFNLQAVHDDPIPLLESRLAELQASGAGAEASELVVRLANENSKRERWAVSPLPVYVLLTRCMLTEMLPMNQFENALRRHNHLGLIHALLAALAKAGQVSISVLFSIVYHGTDTCVFLAGCRERGREEEDAGSRREGKGARRGRDGGGLRERGSWQRLYS